MRRRRCVRDSARTAASRSASTSRGTAVRRQIEQAIADGFGESPDERLLAATRRHGCPDPDDGHGRAALDLSVSRATYFRKLREASDRVAAVVLTARYRRRVVTSRPSRRR